MYQDIQLEVNSLMCMQMMLLPYLFLFGGDNCYTSIIHTPQGSPLGLMVHVHSSCLDKVKNAVNCRAIGILFHYEVNESQLCLFNLNSTILSLSQPKTEWPLLTLTMDSLVWAISEITPSVTIRSTKYWEPSFTEEAYLKQWKQKNTTENKTVPLYVMVTKYNCNSQQIFNSRKYLSIC